MSNSVCDSLERYRVQVLGNMIKKQFEGSLTRELVNAIENRGVGEKISSKK